MREVLQDLFESDKEIRMGKVIKFKGIIGGSRRDLNVLINNIRKVDDDTQVADHVWLGTIECKSKECRDLLACKVNKDKEVIFEAQILPYNMKTDFGLRLTRDSDIQIGEVSCNGTFKDRIRIIYEHDEDIQAGKLVKFEGTVGGKRKDTNTLITNIKLYDDSNDIIGDEAWLGTHYCHGNKKKQLLASNINKGKKVQFTAKIKRYFNSWTKTFKYGLELTDDSEITVME